MQIEDEILMAALKVSNGQNPEEALDCLHGKIKASEDALVHDLEALNWFDLSIPTDLLKCQCSKSLPSHEVNNSLVSQNVFERPVGQTGEFIVVPSHETLSH